jgi:prophage antirepressor-like protein
MQKNAKNNETPKIETFLFGEMPIRVIIGENSEPWFVASDLAKALDLQNLQMSVKGSKARNYEDGIDDRYVSNAYIPHPQSKAKTLNVLVVLEPGVYQLIFKSRKPEARAFQAWVFEQVLPTIRKTGGYEMPDSNLRYDENEVALNQESADYKLDYELNAATKLIDLIDTCIDQKLRTFQRMEMKNLENRLLFSQKQMENNLMEFIQLLANQIGNTQIQDAQAKKPRPSHVYLMRMIEAPFNTGLSFFCKFGKGNLPDSRLFVLEAGGIDLELLDAIPFDSEAIALAWERAFRIMFKHLHIKREWYLLEQKHIDFFTSIVRAVNVLNM